MPKDLIRGSSQGFGFAVGMIIGFGLVSYVVAKGLDRQLKGLITDAEGWLIDQTERVASEHERNSSPAGPEADPHPDRSAG